nr:disease resistance protein RGA2 [Aegilops tauschii subsp. strangulata]
MVGVGEMIASAVVKQVTSRLIKIAGDEIALQWKFKGDVDKMVEKMKDLEAVMHDADNKVSQGGDVGKEVGRWLLKLKSVAYDVEDLLDDLDTKNNEAKLKAFFSRDNPAYRWITRPHNLLDVRKRIEEIENDSRAFKLVPQEKVERSRKNETFAPSSDRGTSTGMQGRSAEKDKLVNLILRSEANVDISIIPIVGLGGIGKTTLAQSVFADKRVDIFDIQAWVHVSEKFDLLQIMSAIIKSVDANINLDNITLQYLQDCLQDKLADKKYLIVLDDFWEEGGDNLEKLKLMLQHGSSGSRIIVTTRNQTVVKKMKTGVLAHKRLILPVHESDQINLDFLSTNDCWELIKIRAFEPDDDPTPLKQIGYEIAGKCGGLPLVANAFGHVMSEHKSIKAWQDIKVRMVNLGLRSECQNDTLESLKLSYYYMKREFKICFAYLAAFPKGFLIDTNRLIQQWNALGYIHSEYDGESCINYLLGMSFLQISGHPTDNLSPVHAKASQKLIMHDLVHDLALVIAADEFLVLDARGTGPRSWKKEIHCRHAELIQYQNQSKVFDCLPKKLRSLHIRDLHEWQLPPKAFSGSKYMRVLDLACAARKLSQGQSASSKIMLPHSIEKLKLLRYLDATGLQITSLSKSTSTLQNMETLIMSNCSLETLPDNICSLHKLCYLDLSGNRSLDKLPTSLGKLSKLSFLNFSGCSVLQVLPKSICELACLEHLDISDCCVIQNLPDKFGSLLQLIFLDLSGCFMLQELPESIWQLTCLQHLDMSECRAIRKLPDKFGSLLQLIFLNLSGCFMLQELPESICQLTCLQHLDMSECRAIQNLPYKFGSLPTLIFLNMSGCSKITKLPDNLILQSLEHMNLSNCHELENLPKDFGNLQRLEFLSLSDCYKVSLLPESFCQLNHLKFLDLSDCHELMELPECFSHLVELDSLNLTSCCKLQVLPESFCKLSKLRYLSLSYCMRLDKLLPSFGDLKLQSLDISCTESLNALPDSIDEMTSLTRFEARQGAPDVIARVEEIKKHLIISGEIEHVVQQRENKGCSSIVELADLTCYALDVQELQNVKHPEDAERAKLRDKSDLRQLTLRWGTNGGQGKSVLEKLTPRKA